MPTTVEIRRGHGASVWWSKGSVITVNVGHEATGGPFAVAEQLCPPGYATPLHVHRNHDEALIAMEDSIEMYYGSEPDDLTVTQPAIGDGVYLESGAPHGFHNTATAPRRISILFESPLEMGFLEAGIPVDPPVDGLPTPPAEVLESERVGALGEEYATDALGSLPVGEDPSG